jgi:siroheme synthase-like protein
VVIGGGAVAERKVEALLAAGARVTVIAPEVTPALTALAETHEIVHLGRGARRGDLHGAFLAIAATDDEAIQRAVAAEADSEKALLNVVDVPHLCTVTFPAIHRQGPLTVAVSSSGTSPGLARRLRDDLTHHVGAEYGILAGILGGLRARRPPGPARREMLTRLLESPVLDWLREGRTAEVDSLLVKLGGTDCSLAALGLQGETGKGGCSGDDDGS